MKFVAMSILAVILSANGVSGAVRDVCVLGTGAQFTRTTRLRLDIGGELPRDSGEQRVVSSLLKRILWEGQAERIFVEPFDARSCSAALGELSEVSVTLSAAEVEALKNDDERGVPVARILGELVSRVMVRWNGAPRRADGQESFFNLNVQFATNRNERQGVRGSTEFGAEHGKRLTFGSIDVTVQRDPKMGLLEPASIVRIFFGNETSPRVEVSSPRLWPRIDWLDQVLRVATTRGRPGVLLFVHGYNTSFEDAAKTAGQLAYDLGFAGSAMFFSWPSRRDTLEYVADSAAADWSVASLKELLADLGRADVGPIYILAHSMGNRILAPALSELTRDRSPVVDLIAQVIMAAPDLGVDTFTSRWAPDILGKRYRTTLYAANADLPIAASEGLNGEGRLGAVRDRPTMLPGMDSIDASAVRMNFLGHSYFSDSASVVSDIFYLVRQGLPPDRRLLDGINTSDGRYWRFRR